MSDPSAESATLESAPSETVLRDRALLKDAQARGPGATLGAFLRLSGPGWLQSAITLGGGSLAGALYLGILGGYSFLWVQLTAIFFGVIMLSAISYVTLSTGQRPFQAIKTHVNPTLAWAWALATFAANIVWSLPQFGLATTVLQQNLLPGVVGPESSLGQFGGQLVCSIAILVVTISVVLLYDKGGWGVKLFDFVLKAMVGVVVLCFFGVAIKLALTAGVIDWGAVLQGFIPDLSRASAPAGTFTESLQQISEPFREFWSNRIVSLQREVMITAAATAVGINMTFLLPYSMLTRGWDRTFRGLAIFDLGTGMAIPYFLATSCVVLAAASQFHGKPGAGLLGDEGNPSGKLVNAFNSELSARANWTLETTPQYDSARNEWSNLDDASRQAARQAAAKSIVDEIPLAERRLAATIAQRDTGDLSAALEPLTGKAFADVAFGIGVLGMGVSTIIILMLISGFVTCEMFGFPQGGWAHRIGCLAPAVGVLGPFFWSKAAPYLAVPTSLFGMVLLPVAYLTFFLMMNNRRLLGDAMPTGGRRVLWNTLMALACTAACSAAGWVAFTQIRGLWNKSAIGGGIAVAALVVFLLLIIAGERFKKPAPPEQ